MPRCGTINALHFSPAATECLGEGGRGGTFGIHPLHRGIGSSTCCCPHRPPIHAYCGATLPPWNMGPGRNGDPCNPCMYLFLGPVASPGISPQGANRCPHRSLVHWQWHQHSTLSSLVMPYGSPQLARVKLYHMWSYYTICALYPFMQKLLPQ